MTHRYDSSNAVSWQGEDPPNGFDRTLSPSDPRARAGAPASGYAVRDNRKQVVFPGGQCAAVEAQTPPAPTFQEIPVSGVRQLSSSDRLRAGIPVAQITRDLDDAPFEMDTWFDPRRQPDTVMELTPDFASEYVPPQPVPEVAQHKTFELRAVRLSPEIHPRTAPTVLNARAIQRRHDKQQKDAREIADLLDQAHRRRRGPLIAFAFLLVVAIGFMIGVELADSTAAGAESEAKPVAALPVAPPPTAAAVPAAPPDAARQVQPGPDVPTAPAAAAAPSTRGPVAREPESSKPESSKPKARLASRQTQKPDETQTPQAPAPAPRREVWLE